jgi:beta-glucanase (GH16 family)
MFLLPAATRGEGMPRAALLALVLLPLGCGGPAPATAPSGGSFEPSWSDEFEGSAVDATRWHVMDEFPQAWPETPWRRNWKKENVTVEDGALVIRTVREPVGFSTGAVVTGDWGKPVLFQQAFGRFEARVRFPRQPGHWCAFWLENPDVGRVDGSGRDGTEIDVMEKAWLVDQAQHTLHWDGYAAAHRSAEQLVTGRGLNDGGWHVFRVDWTPDEYVFFVDDRETWRTRAGGVCQSPNWILLTEEIGNVGSGPGQWGVGPIEQATLPDEYRVDYVRVWRYVPPAG